ncbi:MAG: DUF2249 domain-containing protein [Chloroflexi bacterium]|nr:DUF2249 domain-containing protein [Chloroflexota bacterium]
MSATETLTTKKPITPNMKVGDVLKEYPALLDVFVAQSPQFSRLRNPILRRIHGRLVTVAQAAAVAGLDPAVLVRTLNRAIGLDVDATMPIALNSRAGTPQPSWVTSAVVAAQLDVREDQRSHSDPFARIMKAVSDLDEGQILYLRNTFEPLPLYDVLGKRGFVAWARRLGEDDWEIYFLKVGRGASREENDESKAEATQDQDWEPGTPTAAISIDVRELTPPQPMMKILNALDHLKPGETLLVHHVRRPAYLYPKLAELGYKQKTVEVGPDQVDIYIRNQQRG